MLSHVPKRSQAHQSPQMAILSMRAAILGLIGLAISPVPSLPYPPRPVFAPDSFWYRPIPVNAPLNPNTAIYVAEFQRQYHSYYNTVGINIGAYSAPIYAVGPAAKTVAVAQWNCQNYLDPDLPQQWGAVPIPAYARPAYGTDAEMTVYQPSSDTMWEFWQARQTDGHWQACWGGKMSDVSKNKGIWPQRYGVAATGLPFAPGQITAQELKAGAIHHVMGIALVDAEKSSIFSWPATRSDGYNPQNAPNRIPEGLRFRLDPTINVDALNISPVAKTIAKAAQTYGFVVWDKAGSVSLRFENPLAYTLVGQPNPYPVIFNGMPEYALLKGFPWERLQFLPMDYGKPT
jgi:hypothetical protein